MKTRGFTLVEAMFGLVLLSIVALIVYGLFLAAEGLWASETVLRDREFRVRGYLEQVWREVSETNQSFFWSWTDESLPAGTDTCFAFLSPRESGDSDVYSGMKISDRDDPNNGYLATLYWRSLILYAPEQESGGSIRLRRYQAGLRGYPPVRMTASFGKHEIVLRGAGVDYSFPRSEGVEVLHGVSEFRIRNLEDPHRQGLGPTEAWTISVCVQGDLGKGKKANVRMSTTVLPRNRG